MTIWPWDFPTWHTVHMIDIHYGGWGWVSHPSILLDMTILVIFPFAFLGNIEEVWDMNRDCGVASPLVGGHANSLRKKDKQKWVEEVLHEPVISLVNSKMFIWDPHEYFSSPTVLGVRCEHAWGIYGYGLRRSLLVGMLRERLQVLLVFNLWSYCESFLLKVKCS